MIDLTKPVTFSAWRIPVAPWTEFFGADFPEKGVCLNGHFRPLPRFDDHVYAICTLIDRTPNKERWERHGHLWLIDQGAEVLSGGGRPEHVWRLPPAHEPNILRSLVYRDEDANVREEAAARAELEALPFDLHAEAVVEAARAVLGTPRRPRSVPMSAVEDQDVIEAVGVRPVNFFTGKASR